MAQLIVRNIETEVKERLHRRAKHHGRSMEEEVREILRDATKADDRSRRSLGTEIASLFRNRGLRKSERLRELRDISLQTPIFRK